MNNINVYCCGDSFTAGWELLDHLLPGFPGFSTTPHSNSTSSDKAWSNRRLGEGCKYFKNESQFRQAQINAAWPHQLANFNNISVTNNSMDGISITGIANRTLVDLLNTYSLGETFDFVFIQLTSPARFEIYNKTMQKSYLMNERALGWFDTFNTPTEKQLAHSIINQYSDSDYSIKYLYTICMLKNAVKGITGKYPILLGSKKEFVQCAIDSIKNNPHLSSNDIIQTLMGDSGIENIPDDDFMQTIHETHNLLYTPLSHYEQRTHNLYAEYIYNKYIK